MTIKQIKKYYNENLGKRDFYKAMEFEEDYQYCKNFIELSNELFSKLPLLSDIILYGKTLKDTLKRKGNEEELDRECEIYAQAMYGYERLNYNPEWDDKKSKLTNLRSGK